MMSHCIGNLWLALEAFFNQNAFNCEQVIEQAEGFVLGKVL